MSETEPRSVGWFGIAAAVWMVGLVAGVIAYRVLFFADQETPPTAPQPGAQLPAGVSR